VDFIFQLLAGLIKLGLKPLARLLLLQPIEQVRLRLPTCFIIGWYSLPQTIQGTSGIFCSGFSLLFNWGNPSFSH
jgi:hypothetical protein